jgi:hypothetical protein
VQQTEGGFALGFVAGLLILFVVVLLVTAVPMGEESRPILDIKLR